MAAEYPEVRKLISLVAESEPHVNRNSMTRTPLRYSRRFLNDMAAYPFHDSLQRP